MYILSSFILCIKYIEKVRLVVFAINDPITLIFFSGCKKKWFNVAPSKYKLDFTYSCFVCVCPCVCGSHCRTEHEICSFHVSFFGVLWCLSLWEYLSWINNKQSISWCIGTYYKYIDYLNVDLLWGIPTLNINVASRNTFGQYMAQK